LVFKARDTFATGVPKLSQKNITTCLSKEESYHNSAIHDLKFTTFCINMTTRRTAFNYFNKLSVEHYSRYERGISNLKTHVSEKETSVPLVDRLYYVDASFL
jgi:hypothetical protein